MWPQRAGAHLWADRLNAIHKYVFSSKLEGADWANSSIIRGVVPTELGKLKQQDAGNLLIWGHGLLAQTVLKHRLREVLDLWIQASLQAPADCGPVRAKAPK